jgi:hypothetical protein
MRGQPFHNKIVNDAQQLFSELGWESETEYRYSKDGTTTFFDLYARDAPLHVACEIETSCRHAIDNFKKAQAVRMPLWIIVPTRKIRSQIQRSLGRKQAVSAGMPVIIMVPDELKKHIVKYMSQKP